MFVCLYTLKVSKGQILALHNAKTEVIYRPSYLKENLSSAVVICRVADKAFYILIFIEAKRITTLTCCSERYIENKCL